MQQNIYANEGFEDEENATSEIRDEDNNLYVQQKPISSDLQAAKHQKRSIAERKQYFERLNNENEFGVSVDGRSNNNLNSSPKRWEANFV